MWFEALLNENFWIHGQFNVTDYCQHDVECIFVFSYLSANKYFISRGPGTSGLKGPTRAAGAPGARIGGRALGALRAPARALSRKKKKSRLSRKKIRK